MPTTAAQVRDIRPTEPEHCIAIRPGAQSTSKQGHHVFEGISAQSTAPARCACTSSRSRPAGGRAHAHLHADHESAVYMAQGDTVCWYGDRLQLPRHGPSGRDGLHPGRRPAPPINASEHEPVTCIIARTDPNEQESVVLLPELEALGHTQLHDRGGVVVELDSVRR